MIPLALYLEYDDFKKSRGTAEEIFTRIYQGKLWGEESGLGSDPINAEPYIHILQSYIDQHDIHSIVDFGCGDFRLMAKIKIPESKLYQGFDVVKFIVDDNIRNHQSANVSFYHIDGIEDFKSHSGDLLLVKDVFIHWTNKDIQYFIANILPNFKYALITNDLGVGYDNREIRTGEYRSLDLEAEPFNIKSNIYPILDYAAHGITKRVYLYKKSL